MYYFRSRNNISDIGILLVHFFLLNKVKLNPTPIFYHGGGPFPFLPHNTVGSSFPYGHPAARLHIPMQEPGTIDP